MHVARVTSSWFHSGRIYPDLWAREDPPDLVHWALLSPDGRRVALFLFGHIGFLDVESEKVIRLRRMAGPVLSMAFSRDGRFLAVNSSIANGSGGLLFWDLSNPGWHRELRRFGEDFDQLSITARARDVVGSAPGDDRIWVWGMRVSPGPALARFTAELNAVCIAPDANTAWIGAEDRSLKKVDLSTGRPEGHMGGFPSGVTSLVEAEGLGLLVAGHWDGEGTISLRDRRDGSHLDYLKGHLAPVRALALSPDGRTLASGSRDGTVRLWDLASRQPLKTLRGHEKDVRCVAFTKDGAMVVSGSEDGTVRTWWARSGRPAQTYPIEAEATCLAMDPRRADEALAVGLDDGRIVMLELDGSAPREVGHIDDENGVLSLAFSPDGLTIAAGGAHGSLTLWDTTAMGRALSLELHDGELRSLAFTGDGHALVSVGQDGRVGRFGGADSAAARTESEVPEVGPGR